MIPPLAPWILVQPLLPKPVLCRCEGCAARIKAALEAADGVLAASVDFGLKEVGAAGPRAQLMRNSIIPQLLACPLAAVPLALQG